MTWKYQHPPRGRTGDSCPWLFPLITRTSGPSGPSGNALGMLKETACQPHSCASKHPKQHILLRFKLLVRRLYHLVLLRQVDPKLEATRFGLSRLVDRHFSVDDWKSDLVGFDTRLYSRYSLPRPCHGECDYYGSVGTEKRIEDVPRTSTARRLHE